MIELEILIVLFVVVYVITLGVAIFYTQDTLSPPPKKMKKAPRKKLVIPAADPPKPELLLETKKKPRSRKAK